jgi:hypothetical protein
MKVGSKQWAQDDGIVLGTTASEALGGRTATLSGLNLVLGGTDGRSTATA